MDLDGRVEQWLEDNLFKVQENVYFSQSSLKSHLFLPEVPVYESVPASMQNAADIVFGGPIGETVRLHGYDVAYPPHTDLALPLTLYWEAAAPMDRRYKYQVQLVELLDDGSQQVLSTLEQEPYMGAIPTLYWDPGKIIVEYTELPPSLLAARRLAAHRHAGAGATLPAGRADHMTRRRWRSCASPMPVTFR